MLSKVDVGKRDIYAYHVLNSTQSIKVDMKVVEAWFPKTAHQEEIFVLNKLLSLANWMDGQYISFTAHTLPLAFMTTCSKPNYNKAGEFLGYMHNKEAPSLAVSRFNNFAARGLVEGRPNCFAVSFSGRLKLEEQVNISDSCCAEIADSILTLRETIDSSIEYHNKNTELLMDNMKRLIELLEGQNKPTVKNFLSVANDTTSLFSSAVSVAPAVVSVIKKIISLL